MRKIVSKHEAAKKKKRNQLIAGGVLILVMFMSVAGYAFQNSALGGSSSSSTNSTQTVSYNGINFQNVNGFWVLQSGSTRLVFTYNPNEISALNITGFAGLTKTISDYSGKPLYVYYNSSDASSSNAESEVSYNMKNFASSVQTGNLSSLSNGGLGPNCAFNTIIIQNGTSGVEENQNCIYIYGQGEDLIKLADNVLFKLLGIMN